VEQLNFEDGCFDPKSKPVLIEEPSCLDSLAVVRAYKLGATKKHLPYEFEEERLFSYN